MPTLLIKRQKKGIKKTMRELPEKEFKNEEAKSTLTSEQLAALIVDALIDAGASHFGKYIKLKVDR